MSRRWEGGDGGSSEVTEGSQRGGRSGPRIARESIGARGAPAAPTDGGIRVNDFAVKIATVNGTGSASANGLLRRAIFRMGIPVSGKNLFPSNIQGLPTWYEIRVNERGHVARTPRFDVMVAMNPASYERDVAEVRSGGWVLHDSTWPLDAHLRRDDVTFLGVPLADLCLEHFEGARERILMKNIAYVGVLSALLDIGLEVIEELLAETFAKKKKLLDSNFLAVRLGRDHALERFDCPLPVRLEERDLTADKILVDGNTAAALGCVYAGATVAAWYPITPSTSLVDAFAAFCARYRRDEEAERNRFAVVQAEDELSAAGMVVGAGWAGARAFTATSGPGISLMNEFIGLAYYAEIPGVFIDVQRTGPSTGMPTRTQQGDFFEVVYASHGDTRHIALFPADPGECFDFAVRSFDLAERFQTPVFMVSDLDIGMNDWVCDRLEWDDVYRPDRGKVLSAEELERMERYHRYLDVDGDEIPPRSLPGVHEKGAYFTRGSGHTKWGTYTEDSDEYVEVVDRLDRKILSAAAAVPQPEIVWAGRRASGDGAAAPARSAGASPSPGDSPLPGSPLGLLTAGGCRGAVLEAMEELAARGIVLDFMRIRAFPFPESVEAYLLEHELNFVVEQNRDAQLRSILVLETAVDKDRLASVRYYGGLPMSAHHVVDGVLARLEEAGRTGREEASDPGARDHIIPARRRASP
ncbi:MAG: 2-oxoacid:acceptor oxidoreductase subunit alpha [bacterium]